MGLGDYDLKRLAEEGRTIDSYYKPRGGPHKATEKNSDRFCDFCGKGNRKYIYYMLVFNDVYCCSACKELVESGDWDGLMASMSEKHSVGLPQILAQTKIRKLVEAFRSYKTPMPPVERRTKSSM